MTGEKLQRTSYRDPNTPDDRVRSGTTTLAENEQDMDQYYRPLERIHGSSLHGWGVAGGLGVTATLNSPTLTIQPGVALDSSGRHIALAVGGNAEVGQNPTGFSTGATFVPVTASGVVMPTAILTGDKYLTLQFWETFDSDSYNNLGIFRYFHTPWVQLLDVANFVNDGTRIILAKVSLGTGTTAGQVTALVPDVRRATDLPVGSIHLQRNVQSAASGKAAAATVEAGAIWADVAGGLDITVPNPTDEVHLARDDGGNFAKVSLGAKKVVARRNDKTESVVIDTESGSITTSGSVTTSSVTASGPITASNINVQNSVVGNNVSASTATVSGPITAGSIATSGGVTAGSVTASGPVNASSLAVSGGVTAGSVTASGPVNASSLAVSGGVTAGSVDIAGDVHIARNVGIGTSNPQTKLEIQSGFNTEVLRFGHSTVDYHSISTSFHGSTPSWNYLGFNLEYNSSDVRRVLTLQGDGNVVANGNITAGSITSNSNISANNGSVNANTATIYNAGNQHAAYLASDCCAAWFTGDVHVAGTLSKLGGGFQIDHPTAPAEKFLNHSFVESPERKNIYDGIAVLDANGEAVIELPTWFEPLNSDFRYQLTPLGAPGPNLYIAQEIANHHFSIAGGTPSMRISWQVTAIRQDAWAKAHPMQVEEEKSAEERGHFLQPELHGASEEKNIAFVLHS